jgi:hypothetical protein
MTVEIDCSKAKFIEYFNIIKNERSSYIRCDNSNCIFHGDRSEQYANICNLHDIYNINPLETVNEKEIIISIKDK